MMVEKKWFPIFYMFAVTAFFSSIVIGFTIFSAERVEANERLAFEESVLAALDLEVEGLSNVELHEMFVEQVSEPSEGTGGAYTLQKNGVIEAYALPFAGQGFWAPIRGVIGIDEDKETVTGVAFYEQNETPGLGAEITKPAFRDQFEGKVISYEGRPLNVRRPTAQLGRNDVHAITGATQTSVRLEKIINDALDEWQNTMNNK